MKFRWDIPPRLLSSQINEYVKGRENANKKTCKVVMDVMLRKVIRGGTRGEKEEREEMEKRGRRREQLRDY